MSFSACADIVRVSDTDRFRATMAAPAEFRGPLFAIYAFNVEVSRAPWVSAEPTINAIRLQWWLDALQEISEGRVVRRHQVATPLAEVIDADMATDLAELVRARNWDNDVVPFADAPRFRTYLDQTSGNLMWVAARAISPDGNEKALRDFGYASGLANLFRAVPALVASGRSPLIDESDGAIRDLAVEGLQILHESRRLIRGAARYPAYAGWQANSILRTVAANPATVNGGRLHNSEFSRRASLLLRVLSGRP